MYNWPIEANLWSDSKKKWLPCVSDFEAYWLASKWLRWKIDYLDTRAVIKYKIEATESGLVLISIKDILSKGSNSNISAFYSSPIYSSSSRSSKNKSRSSMSTSAPWPPAPSSSTAWMRLKAFPFPPFAATDRFCEASCWYLLAQPFFLLSLFHLKFSTHNWICFQLNLCFLSLFFCPYRYYDTFVFNQPEILFHHHLGYLFTWGSQD